MMRLPACLRVKLFPDNCAPVPTYRQGSEGVEDWLVDLGVDRETVQRIIERLDNILRAEIMEDEEEEIRERVESIVKESLRSEILNDWLDWLQDAADKENKKSAKGVDYPADIREWLVNL